MIQGDDCYDRIITQLPSLRYSLDSADGLTGLEFGPEDYIERSGNSSICFLELNPVTERVDLQITNRLLRKLGGIHFDYANNRLGFFDPIA